ncbi:ABC transporter ATP-binding protein [Pelosinus sp. sgz500959]|uniref:ABC transporter ATP-binding protein n=1 Tax=Pelosinus sp. sgz500959 TaxID=3242472 RepID=UPI00366D9B6B
MFTIIKKLSPTLVIAAIACLLVQIGGSLYLPYVTADIINKGVMTGNVSYIWSKGISMMALSFCSLLGALGNVLIFSQVSYKLGGELRSAMYRKVLSFSKYEFDQFGASTLMTRNTNDVMQVQNLVEMGLKFILLSLSMLVGGIVMTALLSPKLALIYLTTVPFLAAAAFAVYRFSSPLYARMQQLLDTLNMLFREGLTGVKVIRAYSSEDKEYKKYKTANEEYTKTAMRASTIMSLFFPLIILLISLSTIGVVWIGSKAVAAGTMEIGSIMGAIGYAVQILMGFGMLANVILAISRGQISAVRINEVLSMPLYIKDPQNSSEPDKGALCFEQVDFSYPGAEQKTLENISLAVKEGQTLAIIGSIGDGKSSMVNLIGRLYDVEKGRITIGGTDIRALHQSKLHEVVSMAAQKSILFMGTVRDNMLLSKQNATDDEIWAALTIASAAEFITSLDQVVEKNGSNFSGGQKQRLCIARALLKDAQIYIFDDSFSALDFKTDVQVRTAIKAKLKDAITLIVAQRISTVINADVIVVLDKGKIAGFGAHEQLSLSNSVYQEIMDSQYYKGVAK